jgi:hypothetical protein
MPVLAPLPPPIAASAAPPAPALDGPGEFELPPDLALDDLGTVPQPATDDLVAVDDLLVMDEEPPKGGAPAPAGGVDDFDPADILLLEEEPPSKDKKK